MGMRRHLQFLFPIVVCLILIGCAGGTPSGGVYAWIDVPLDGLTVPLNQTLNIEGHADAPSGVSRIEIWINSEIVARIDSPQVKGNLAKFQTDWIPPEPGEYSIQAVAVASDGTISQPHFRRIYVSGSAPTVPPSPTGLVGTPTVTGTTTPTLTPTGTPTETIPPDVVVEFWAEPPQIQAGTCSNLRWHVENALNVRLGGSDVPHDGSFKACLCEDESYTLTVTQMDGNDLQRQLTIGVTGSCVTPTLTPTETEEPPEDNTPPPAPSPYLPANGASVSCGSLVGVAWDAVSDPSGIDEYQVQVELIISGSKTKPHPDSPWTGLTATGLKVPVQCGAVYRWRVRAVDGAGNVGNWSSWYQFGVNMG